jgi:predicted secreted protein
MTRLIYHIVEHDGGWAYQVEGAFSETFPSHDAARTAAETAAREQRVAGATVGITWEDANGRWQSELSEGTDRPDTDVEG